MTKSEDDVRNWDHFLIGLIDFILCFVSLMLFMVLFSGVFIFLRRSGSCSSHNVLVLTALQMGLVFVVAVTSVVFGDDADYRLLIFFVFVQPAIVLILNLLLLLSTLFSGR